MDNQDWINNINNINNNEEEISITDTLFHYMRYWKWFVLSAAICLVIGTVYILVTPKEYQTSLAILLNEDDKKGTKSGAFAGINIEALGLLSPTNNIDNEIVVLSSPDLMHPVVDSLNLRTTYYIKQQLRKTELSYKSPFFVSIQGVDNEQIGGISFYIVQKNNEYKIEGKYKNTLLDIDTTISETVTSFPANIKIDDTHIIDIQTTGQEIEEGEKYYVTISSTYAAVAHTSSLLAVSPTSKTSSVLIVEITGNNVKKNAAILKELVKQYNLLNINMKNEIAYNTSLFINDRLKEISAELGDAENNLVDYKQEHKIADLSTEAGLFVTQTGVNEQKLLDIEIQLNVISYIEHFVNEANNKYAVIPNIGITDVGLTQIINEYNAKLLASEVKLRGMGQENPALIKITEDIGNMRSSISNALKNVKHTFNVTKQELLRQSNQNKARVLSVPRQEMGLLEKSREQQIKQTLFLFLMQKREETNLTIASTPSKARIVVSPQEDRAIPIAPKGKIILFAALLIGLLIPFIIIYLRNLLNTQIQNRNELEKLSIVPIAGQIAKNAEKSEGIVVEKGATGGNAEMFRTLRNSLNFVFNNHKKQVIVVTSTTKGEGKTFISANLAVTYALTGKKVLLVGGDIRNPQLKKYFDNSNKSGLSNYLSEADSSWKDFVKATEVHSSLFLLVAGTVPPNPNELLMSPRLKEFIDEAREAYDIVIIDTAPVGLVSDTYLIDEHVDATLYVVREGITPRDAVNFINTQKTDGRLKNMYLVLNDSNLESHYYKYKYGYGKEYGYHTKQQ